MIPFIGQFWLLQHQFRCCFYACEPHVLQWLSLATPVIIYTRRAPLISLSIMSVYRCASTSHIISSLAPPVTDRTTVLHTMANIHKEFVSNISALASPPSAHRSIIRTCLWLARLKEHISSQHVDRVIIITPHPPLYEHLSNIISTHSHT